MTSYGTLNKTQVPCGMARPQHMEPFLIIWPLTLPGLLQSSCKTLFLYLTIKSFLFPYWPGHLFSGNWWFFPYPAPRTHSSLFCPWQLSSIFKYLLFHSFTCLTNVFTEPFSKCGNPESHGHLAHWAVQGKVLLNKQVFLTTCLYSYTCQCYLCTQHSVLSGALPKT